MNCKLRKARQWPKTDPDSTSWCENPGTVRTTEARMEPAGKQDSQESGGGGKDRKRCKAEKTPGPCQGNRRGRQKATHNKKPGKHREFQSSESTSILLKQRYSRYSKRGVGRDRHTNGTLGGRAPWKENNPRSLCAQTGAPSTAALPRPDLE